MNKPKINKNSRGRLQRPVRRDSDGNPYKHDPVANEAAKGREALKAAAYRRCADFAKAEHLRFGKRNHTGAIEALMNCHSQFSAWAGSA